MASASCNALTGDASFSRPQSREAGGVKEEGRREAGRR